MKRSDERCSIERDALTLKGKVFRREDNGVFIVLESWPETFRSYCTYQEHLRKDIYPSKTEPGGTREIVFTEPNFKMSGAEFIEFDGNGGVKRARLNLECLIDMTNRRDDGTEDKEHYPRYDDEDLQMWSDCFVLSSTP